MWIFLYHYDDFGLYFEVYCCFLKYFFLPNPVLHFLSSELLCTFQCFKSAFLLEAETYELMGSSKHLWSMENVLTISAEGATLQALPDTALYVSQVLLQVGMCCCWKIEHVLENYTLALNKAMLQAGSVQWLSELQSRGLAIQPVIVIYSYYCQIQRN